MLPLRSAYRTQGDFVRGSSSAESDAVFKYGADKLCSLISGALDKIVTVLESSEKYVTERMVAEGIAKARSGAIGMEDEE